MNKVPSTPPLHVVETIYLKAVRNSSMVFTMRNITLMFDEPIDGVQ